MKLRNVLRAVHSPYATRNLTGSPIERRLACFLAPSRQREIVVGQRVILRTACSRRPIRFRQMNVEPVGMVELVERMTCGAFLPLNARGVLIVGSHDCLAGILVLSRRGSGWALTLGSGELVRLTLGESS